MYDSYYYYIENFPDPMPQYAKIAVAMYIDMVILYFAMLITY